MQKIIVSFLAFIIVGCAGVPKMDGPRAIVVVKEKSLSGRCKVVGIFESVGSTTGDAQDNLQARSYQAGSSHIVVTKISDFNNNISLGTELKNGLLFSPYPRRKHALTGKGYKC